MKSKSQVTRAGALLLVAFLVLGLAVIAGQIKGDPGSGGLGQAGLAAPFGGLPAASAPAPAGQFPSSARPLIITGRAAKFDRSPPLRSLRPLLPAVTATPCPNHPSEAPIRLPGFMDGADPVVQRFVHALESPAAMPGLLTNWAGIASVGAGGVGCGCSPPDPNGDIGPNHYIQVVNMAFQIYNRSGTIVYGPALNNTIWTGFGGTCETSNDGDPVVLYDSIADRWLFSQFTATSPYAECVAVSATADPTGAWNRYAFQLSTSDFADYPKLGVWPDGYYMSVNWYTGGTVYAGPRPYVFDRASMLAGTAATFQTVSAPLGNGVGAMLPADLDGPTLPPAGAPNVFASFGNPLRLYQFHVDWATPANSTWTLNSSLAVAAFTQLCSGTRDCIPQKTTTQKLDGQGDKLMHRMPYRKFGDHDMILINHTVNVGSGQAGIRWYEIRNPLSSPTIYQQSSYAPDTTLSRWMASAAMDGSGDIAVGYSTAGSTAFPGIAYAGRLGSDPLNALSQGEGTILAGTGYHTGDNRWGDYSGMSIDPADDCTFWYTSLYDNSNSYNWRTQIVSFKFPACGQPMPTPTSTLSPTITPTPTKTATPTTTRTPTKTATPTISRTPTKGP